LVILQVFKRDADLLENWIVSREPLLHDGKMGETLAQVEDLIRKHEDFEKTIEAQEEKFSALRRVTMVSLYFVFVSILATATTLRCSSAKWACV
jgi:spectrin beta